MGRIFPKLRGTAQENIDTKTQWLVAAATRVLPDADPEVLRSCIPRAARTGNALGFLVNDVVPDPQLLVSGSSHSCRVTHRLIRELAAAGVAGVRLAECELCGSTKPLIKRLESGGMACQSCVRQASRTLCARCGQVRPRGRELPDGSVICDLCSGKDWYQPCSRCGRVAKARRRLGADGVLCGGCEKKDPSYWVECHGCGSRAPLAARSADGALCRNCYERPGKRCDRCGRVRKINSHKSGETVCLLCYRVPQAVCRACQHPRPRTRGRCEPECPKCGSTAVLECGACHGEAFGFSTSSRSGHRCLSCRFRARIVATLSDESGTIASELVPFIDTLASIDNPEQGIRWLLRGYARTVLTDIAQGRKPLTHATFDEAAGDRVGRAIAVDHLRRLMVAAGLLPVRDEYLARLEMTIEARLRHVHPGDETVLRAYATWYTLPRARRRVELGRASISVCHSAKSMLSAPFNLLAWLREQGIMVDAIPQAAVDEWLGRHPSDAIDLATFFSWTQPRGLTSSVFIPPQTSVDPTSFMASDEQWVLARTCLHDQSMQHRYRLAACLVLLYGQTAGNIVALRRLDVVTHGGVTTIQLGPDALELSEPLGQIARELADGAVPDAWTGGIARAFPNVGEQWLFPGRGPGKPLGPAALRTELVRLGIHCRAARNTALLTLARDVPTVVLSDLLGVGISTAERWRQYAGGSWTAYAPAGGYRPATQTGGKIRS